MKKSSIKIGGGYKAVGMPDALSDQAIGARLRSFMKAVRIVQRDLAELFEVPQSSISEIVNGNQPLSSRQLVRLVARYNLNPAWLLAERGEPFKVSEEAEPFAAPRDDLLHTLRHAAELVERHWQQGEAHRGPDIIVLPPHVSSQKYEALHPHVVRTVDQIVPIPILSGAIAAGAPTEVWDAEIEDWAFCYRPHLKHPDATSAVHVRGDSMEPHIRDGGLVGVDHAVRDVEAILKADQPLAAVREPDGQGVLIRWLEVEDHIAIFKPTNKKPGYPTIIWNMKNADERNPIVGLVVFKYSANR